MPACMKLKAGKWERDESLGQQLASEYERVIWCDPTDLPPAGIAFGVDDSGKWYELPPEPPGPYELRKDVISKRLFKIGKLTAFDGLLEQDVTAKRLWNDSPCVMSDDENWLQYQAAFIPLLEMTAEEVAYVAKEGTEV